jgi:hypothetical protein
MQVCSKAIVAGKLVNVDDRRVLFGSEFGDSENDVFWSQLNESLNEQDSLGSTSLSAMPVRVGATQSNGCSKAAAGSAATCDLASS